MADEEPVLCSSLEEFEAVSSRSHQRTELLHGKVIFMSPAGNRHGRVAGDIYGFLWQHVRKKQLGTLRAAETGFRLQHPDNDPGDLTVRAADVAFLGNEKSDRATEVTFSEVVPDLVVEVHSPGDSVAAAGEKVIWWLACGVLEVWTADPANRTVVVHRPDLTSRTYTRAMTIPGDPLLPGLGLQLSEIFPES